MTRIDHNKLVRFNINNDAFALPIDDVKEIIRPINIVNLPQSPSFIIGVINLRGTIIPIVSLALRLGISDDNSNINNKRILIVERPNLTVGFFVDTVTDVMTTVQSHYEDIPNIARENYNQNLVRNIIKLDQEIVIVLDLNAFFTGEDAEQLMAI